MEIALDDVLVLPTLACAYHRGVVVYVGGLPVSPSDADWTEYLRFVERHKVPGSRMRGLILERGFGPTVAQRRTLRRLTAGYEATVSVLASSPFARAITVLVSLVNPGYESFPWHAVGDALRHLGVSPDLEREFATLLRLLEQKLAERHGPPVAHP